MFLHLLEQPAWYWDFRFFLDQSLKKKKKLHHKWTVLPLRGKLALSWCSLSLLWSLNADKSAEQQVLVFPSGLPSPSPYNSGLGWGFFNSVSASSQQLASHCKIYGACWWEQCGSLGRWLGIGRGVCKSEYCSWAINCSFIWLDFKVTCLVMFLYP